MSSVAVCRRIRAAGYVPRRLPLGFGSLRCRLSPSVVAYMPPHTCLDGCPCDSEFSVVGHPSWLKTLFGVHEPVSYIWDIFQNRPYGNGKILNPENQLRGILGLRTFLVQCPWLGGCRSRAGRKLTFAAARLFKIIDESHNRFEIT